MIGAITIEELAKTFISLAAERDEPTFVPGVDPKWVEFRGSGWRRVALQVQLAKMVSEISNELVREGDRAGVRAIRKHMRAPALRRLEARVNELAPTLVGWSSFENDEAPPTGGFFGDRRINGA